MPPVAAVPPALRYAPFRGSVAIAAGLLTARQLTGPAWRRLFRDVYISAAVTVDHVILCRAAALLLPPGGALSHESAAVFHNVPLVLPGQRRVDVSIDPQHRLPCSDGLAVHRVRLAPEEVVRRCGLPITGPERTALDLGSGRNLVTSVAALDALLFQRTVSATDLAAVADARAGWPGARRFRQAMALARPYVESVMETRLRLQLLGAGLPEPTVQYTVVDGRGHFVARLDLAYEHLRVGLAYDGDHHRDRAIFRQDAVRLNRLRLLGWTVLRFTADDVLRYPDRLIAHVRSAIATANVRLHT